MGLICLVIHYSICTLTVVERRDTDTTLSDDMGALIFQWADLNMGIGGSWGGWKGGYNNPAGPSCVGKAFFWLTFKIL